MPSLTEVREELAAKRKELHVIFAEAGPDLDMSRVTSINGDSAYKAGEIKRRNDELTALGQEYDRLALLESIGRQNETEFKRLHEPATSLPTGGPYDKESAYGATKAFQPRRLRETLLESKQYKLFRDGTLRTASVELPVDIKTLVTLSGISPQNERLPMTPMPLETRTVGDLMVQGATSVGTLEYYEETTNPVPTVAQAAVAEGATKFETTFGWTLRTEAVRKIATFVPATKESLDDVDFLESQIRGRLGFAVTRVEEAELLTGNGTPPQITGLINRTGVQTTAKTAAIPIPDVIYTAMQLIRGSAGAGFAEPTAVIFHPTNWTAVKLLRTADGIYIWGSPSDEGPDRIWGLPVRQTTAMTVNTALVGAFRPWSEIKRREGVTITVSTEHSTFFVDNKVAILAEERFALCVYRPSAFATATALNL